MPGTVRALHVAGVQALIRPVAGAIEVAQGRRMRSRIFGHVPLRWHWAAQRWDSCCCAARLVQGLCPWAPAIHSQLYSLTAVHVNCFLAIAINGCFQERTLGLLMVALL